VVRTVAWSENQPSFSKQDGVSGADSSGERLKGEEKNGRSKDESG
jgi:hypothetical protein